MKEVQVDDLQHEGEIVLHIDYRDDTRNIVEVHDVRKGDKTKVVFRLKNNNKLTMTMKQEYIDNGSMKIFIITQEEDPEYWL